MKAIKKSVLFSALATVAFGVSAQTANNLIVHLKNGEEINYPISSIESLTLDNDVNIVEPAVDVKVLKLLPKLVVIDWGKYERGTGTNGDNGGPRDFDFELALEKDGPAIRKSTSSKNNWLVASMFWPENRFVYGNLTPDTDYWFRITAKNTGDNNGGSEITYFKFHTPAEAPLPANTVLYNDFDDF